MMRISTMMTAQVNGTHLHNQYPLSSTAREDVRPMPPDE